MASVNNASVLTLEHNRLTGETLRTEPIGPPGVAESGIESIERILSARLGRPFADCIG